MSLTRQNLDMSTKLYHENSRMCDVISDEPALLQMMSRFGIPLGVGERTVADVCASCGVDATTFIAVANIMKNGHSIADQYIEKVSVKALVTYLHQSHSYFLDFQLPNIRRKLLEAIDTSQQNEVAFLILRFYDEFIGEVRRHMLHENSKIFTYVGHLLEGKRNASFSIAQFARSHVGTDKKLQELKNIIIKYYSPEPAGKSDLLNNVLFDIFNCEADLRVHCGVEDVLFVPAVQRLEAMVAEGEKGQQSMTAKEDSQDALSEREREILGLIVKGMTNKQVAEQLFISINTVLTHRKNISRKLNIHSVAGLTIYAISNGWVKLDELKLS